MAVPPDRTEQAPVTLSAFLRRERDTILAEWQRRVQALPAASGLSQAELLDHLPHILDRIAAMVEDMEAGRAVRDTGSDPDTHAIERLEEGYDLDEVVLEFAALRQCVLDLWSKEPARAPGGPILNRAIDEAVSTAVIRYMRARERTLVALDRISAAALESADLDGLLGALIRVLLETTASVDSVAIYLRQGGRLHLRASNGMETDARDLASVEVGSRTCAGQIAATRRPLELRDAAHSPLTSDALRRHGARAFYGVPMWRDGEVVGVAHMASRTAHEFSNEDKLLFRAMVERASAALSFHRLVGERDEAQEARALAQEVLEAGDAFFALDRDWRILLVNAAQERLTRTRREDTLGRDFWQVFPAAAQPDSLYWREYHRVMEERVPVRFEEYYAPLDLWTDVTALPTSNGGIAAIFRDVSERRRAEERVRQAVRVRDEFLSMASHDLRSPLAALKLQVQTVLRHARAQDDGKLERSWVEPRLDRMERQLERVHALLEDLLDVSRIQAGRLAIEREELDLAALVRDVASRHEAMFDSAGCTLQVDAPGPVTGRWDALRLEQVVTNLLSNAAKYGRGSPVEVRLEASADRAVLLVRDHGGGIAPEHHQTIFERFERVGDPRACQGTGLGLWIVRRIVEALGGGIRVESAPGRGATFVVELPRRA